MLHFHSSTTSGSACLTNERSRLSILPRQSSSSWILSSMSLDAGLPLGAPLFFMGEGILARSIHGVQAIRPMELRLADPALRWQYLKIMYAAKTDRPLKVAFPAWGICVLESHHGPRFHMAPTRHDFL